MWLTVNLVWMWTRGYSVMIQWFTWKLSILFNGSHCCRFWMGGNPLQRDRRMHGGRGACTFTSVYLRTFWLWLNKSSFQSNDTFASYANAGLRLLGVNQSLNSYPVRSTSYIEADYVRSRAVTPFEQVFNLRRHLRHASRSNGMYVVSKLLFTKVKVKLCQNEQKFFSCIINTPQKWVLLIQQIKSREAKSISNK